VGEPADLELRLEMETERGATKPATGSHQPPCRGVLPCCMMWWLMIFAMVVGVGVIVIGIACCSFVRDGEREERAEGKLLAEGMNSRAAPENVQAELRVSAGKRASGMRMTTPAVAGRGHHPWQLKAVRCRNPVHAGPAC
jgi:hypothetical protein